MMIVLDFETGGLDARRHSCLEVALVHLPSFAFTAIPIVEPEIVTTPEALGVNGINVADLAATRVTPEDAVHQVHDFLRSCAGKYGEGPLEKVTPVGCNVKFDMGFMRRLYDQAGFDTFDAVWSHRVIDIQSVARFLVEANVLPGLESASLDALIKYFRIELVGRRHTALADAIATAKVYECMKLLVQPPQIEIPNGRTDLDFGGAQ